MGDRVSPPPRSLKAFVKFLMRACGLALVVGVLAIPTASAATPDSDPFYSYAGSLADKPNGAILKTRSVTIMALGQLPSFAATQVLYRTENNDGTPDATVATVIKPLTPALPGVPQQIVSYQDFYDGLNGICRPSYTLLQKQASPGATTIASQASMLHWVAQGATVVTADYEGSTDNFGAGLQSGRQTLDAIRATETLINAPAATTKVALQGYSGGSIASMWAAELAGSYAPELNIVGVAAGGVPAFFVHNLPYVSGSTGWAGALPAIGLGLFRAYHLDQQKYLSAKGLQLFEEQAKGCLNQDGYPGLKFEELFKPEYQDWKKDPTLVQVFNSTLMGRSGTPKFPLTMGVGNADGTGDGVMIAKDVQQLAYEYCQRGVNVNFQEYQGMDHYTAIVPFTVQATAFIEQVLLGLPVISGCGSITPGNALTPIPMPQPTSTSTSTPPPTQPSAQPALSPTTTPDAAIPASIESGSAGNSHGLWLGALAGFAALLVGAETAWRRRRQ